MRKIVTIISILTLMIILLVSSANSVSAGFFGFFDDDIDRINQYYITVSPRKDASLDIVYDIEWEVLKDNAGTLSEVFIGIPNSNVNQLKALTNNIASLKENDGRVKVTFKNPTAGKQILNFSFSIHQMNMYTISDGYCNYSFTPGWFDEIKVKDIKILWNSDKALKADTKEINSDGYYVWEGSLGKGKTMTANVDYLESAFKYSRANDKVTSTLNSIIDESGADVEEVLNSTKELEVPTANLNNRTPVMIGGGQSPQDALNNIYKIGGLAIACCLGGCILSVVGGLGRGYNSHGGYGYSRSIYRDRPVSDSSAIMNLLFDSFLGGGGRRRRRWLRLCLRLCRRW